MASGDRLSSALNRSLRAKVTLSVVLPLVLILGSITAVDYKRQQKAALKNLAILASQTAQVIENSVVHQMLSKNLVGLQSTLDAIGEGEMIRDVYLMDIGGRIIFAPKGKAVGTDWTNRDPNCWTCHRLPPGERPSSVVVSLRPGERVFRSMNPIENRPVCQGCHGSDRRILGLLLTDVSMTPLEAPLAAELRENLAWWVATLLVTVLVVNLALNRFVVGRLRGLAGAIADVRRGRMPSPLSEDGQDEIGQLASAFNAMARQVEARDAENRTLAASLHHQSAQRGELLKRVITAQEDERKRVARELHDVLGQSLAGLSLRLEAMERLVAAEPERAIQRLGEIRALSSESTDRMYDLILDLRPSALDDLGLKAALRVHAERLLDGTGISFELDDSHMSGRLPPELETALYRTFQEALSNVVRHAGATQVHVTLAQEGGIFVGDIVDDGHGFDLEALQMDGQNPHGLGLLGIRERVTQCGGRFQIFTRPGKGTRLRIRVPVEGFPCD